MRLYILLLSVLTLWSVNGRGQTNSNLILNGGFEEWRTGGLYEKPRNWYFSVGSIEKSEQAHTGKYSIKLVPIPHTITAMDANSDYFYMPVEQGATYRLSYWYKGSLTQPNCISTMTWCKDARQIRTTSKKTTADMVTDAEESKWKYKSIEFIAPHGANRAGFNFEMKEVNADKYHHLLIDDVVLTKIKGGENTEKIAMPSNIQGTAQQRELFLSWQPVQGKEIKYRVFVNDKLVATTDQPSYIIQKLQPATSYNIGVQTLMPNGHVSDIVKKELRTNFITTSRDDADRVPYLYQLKGYGDCPQVVFLFYKDLYDDNAKITYMLDGKEFTPIDGYKLVFSSLGKHSLIVDITEGDGKSWNLEYNLNVR